MTWTGVAWAIEGGAANPTDGARSLAYASTNGNSGVMGFADCRVAQLNTPAAAVQVAAGVAVIPNRSPSVYSQTYIAPRPVADDTVAITANGGAAVRYDLIVARVENPWLPSEAYPLPVSTADGPYVFSRVLQGVTQAQATDRNAARAYLKSLGMSAIPLAGVSLPANTSAVLASHLTDLRSIANPRTTRKTLTNVPTARANVPNDWADWVAPTAWLVEVPDWATTCTVVATVFGGKVDRQSSSTDGKAYGQLRVRLGYDASVAYSAATPYDFDAPSNSGTTRAVVGVADTVTVPAAYRGTVQRLSLQGDMLGGNQPLYVDATTSVTLAVEYSETAI